MRANRLGLTAATAPDLAGFDFDAFLEALAPAPSIFARHTVGLVDALTQAELAGKRLDDGLPESLEEVIAAYGHRHFKLKVAGSLDADIDRLSRIAAVLDRISGALFRDARRQRAVRSRRRGDRPVAPDRRGAAACAAEIVDPVRRAADRARQGVGRADPCAGRSRFQSRSTSPMPTSACSRPAARSAIAASRPSPARDSTGRCINRARIARWNAEAGADHYFMSAEDLTTQAGVAVQQDLALATLVGATHVERNGHHYVDGMAGAPEQEQLAFLVSASGSLPARRRARSAGDPQRRARACPRSRARPVSRSARCRTGARCGRCKQPVSSDANNMLRPKRRLA